MVSHVRPQEEAQEQLRETVYYTHRSRKQEAQHTRQGHMGKTQGGQEAEDRWEEKALGQGLSWDFLGKGKAG